MFPPRPAFPRRAAIASLALIALVAGASTLAAHDFWLVPNAFHLAPGDELVVRGQTSSRFPTSESAVAVDRVADARLIGAMGEERITGLSTSGPSLMLKHRPTTPGQRIVAVTLAPRSLREAAAGFKRYMELEGASELAARYEREGRLPKGDSITRRYAKYAKTLVEVGRGGPRAFDRAAGHPAELVPLGDPAALRAGDTLVVRVLYRGRPLAGAHVHAGAAPAANAEPREVSVESDNDGLARVAIREPGLWNVRTIHIVPADAGSGADWDVHWTTLVFSVAAPGGAAASSDSLDVARTVAVYHAALQRGDSIAALALLAPDAVILESGGVESRAEYRSHHLPADIAFAQALPGTRSPFAVKVRGDVAWAWSTSVTQGEFRGRQVNSAGAELMVLERTDAGWRITAIHWSSRQRRQ